MSGLRSKPYATNLHYIWIFMYKITQNFWVLFHLFTFVEAMESHRDIVALV